jgi:outer membrane lipoprotein SlyB
MKAVILVAALCLTGVAGCVNTGTTTTVSQAQTLSGTIIGVRPVTVTNQNDDIAGAVVGGLVGGLVGNQIGNGTGRDVATGLGAAGGAIAGSRLAANANNRSSYQWTVRLADGRTMTVVQDGNFGVGQRVNVVIQGNSTRLYAA